MASIVSALATTLNVTATLTGAPSLISPGLVSVSHRSKHFACLAVSTDKLFDKQAAAYLNARPTYPSNWYSMLANQTSSHSLAWDVGTGNGQAAIGVAEHYDEVIATDVSEAQLKLARPHPRVSYQHTPLSMSDDELVNLIGGENSVDLVTVACAVHWFDLPRFYSVINKVLKKPNGVLAVWAYNIEFSVNPEFDAAITRVVDTITPYWHENVKLPLNNYEALPFPFENISLGSEGSPLKLDIHVESSLETLLNMMRSWSGVESSKESGVDLLSQSVIEELENAWGDLKLVKPVVYKGFMLAGKCGP